jgi:hypothetical protein
MRPMGMLSKFSHCLFANSRRVSNMLDGKARNVDANDILDTTASPSSTSTTTQTSVLSKA